jgi:hypothetical protein
LTSFQAQQAFEVAPQFTMSHACRNSFDAMIAAYTNCGGTARADDLALLLDEHRKAGFVNLAKWQVSGDVFSFEWQDHFWVPMFQFNRHDMSVKQEVHRVVRELDGVLDNWTLACWFTMPNAWLKGSRPVDLVDRQFSNVLGAARADRLAAAG